MNMDSGVFYKDNMFRSQGIIARKRNSPLQHSKGYISQVQQISQKDYGSNNQCYIILFVGLA
jgi:hypothetical protein